MDEDTHAFGMKPAFPEPGPPDGWEADPGISLWGYFFAAALTGTMARPGNIHDRVNEAHAAANFAVEHEKKLLRGPMK